MHRLAWTLSLKQERVFAFIKANDCLNKDTPIGQMMTQKLEYDLIVVGCGVAGLSAAVSAAEAGLLERAPIEERDVQSRYTEAYLHMKSHTEVSDDFESHLAENGSAQIDPDFIERSADPHEKGLVIFWTNPSKQVDFR